jgi:organic hydroperoxide reductase OsmC/OhrA
MTHRVDLAQQEDFHFAIRFGDAIPLLHADEAPPLGKGAGPTPDQLLAAAVGNCLSDSLLFALRKFKQKPEPIRTSVEPTVGRNAENRLRVQRIAVRITLGVPASTLQHLDRALSQFESFCTVAESVRQAIPVDVEVYDATGAKLK